MYLLLLLLAALPFASPSPLENTLQTQHPFNTNRTLKFGIFRVPVPDWAVWPPPWLRCLRKDGSDSPAEPVMGQECDCAEAVAEATAAAEAVAEAAAEVAAAAAATAVAEAAVEAGKAFIAAPLDSFQNIACAGADQVPCVFRGTFACYQLGPSASYDSVCGTGELASVPLGSVCTNLEDRYYWLAGDPTDDCFGVNVQEGIVNKSVSGMCQAWYTFPGLCNPTV